MTVQNDRDAEQKKREEAAQKREEELRRIPPQEIDPTTWPSGVRVISMGETNGLGVDKAGRLYWNGKPVEIIGSRLDLTRTQTFIAGAVAFFTLIAALGTAIQAWTAYHDWACKVDWPVLAKCAVSTAAAPDHVINFGLTTE